MLKTEMAYFVHTHKAHKIANKELYGTNNISYDEMFENLIILLGDDVQVCTATYHQTRMF